MRLEDWQGKLVAAMDGEKSSWPEARIRIHRGNSKGARARALGAIFPVAQAIVGEKYFDALTLRFMRERPSRYPNLNECGDGFPRWLRQQLPSLPYFDELPYLAELARLELAVNASYYAADHEFSTVAEFEKAIGLAGEKCLAIPASLHLLQSKWPVDVIWREHQQGRSPAELAWNRCWIVVWRDGPTIRVETQEPAEWRILRNARRGHDLEQLMEAGLAPELLSRWIAQGWVIGFRQSRRPRRSTA